MNAPIFMAIFLASELIAVSIWFLVAKHKAESIKPRQYKKSIEVVENKIELTQLVLS